MPQLERQRGRMVVPYDRQPDCLPSAGVPSSLAYISSHSQHVVRLPPPLNTCGSQCPEPERQYNAVRPVRLVRTGTKPSYVPDRRFRHGHPLCGTSSLPKPVHVRDSTLRIVACHTIGYVRHGPSSRAYRALRRLPEILRGAIPLWNLRSSSRLLPVGVVQPTCGDPETTFGTSTRRPDFVNRVAHSQNPSIVGLAASWSREPPKEGGWPDWIYLP